MISFDIADFKDAVRNLKLLPKTIRSPHRHKGSRALCIYILMWCWTGNDTWTRMARETGIDRIKLLQLYRTTRRLLVQKYRKLITQIDFLRVLPQMVE